MAILEVERLIKTLGKIKHLEVTEEKKRYLQNILFEVQRKIGSILEIVQY